MPSTQSIPKTPSKASSRTATTGGNGCEIDVDIEAGVDGGEETDEQEDRDDDDIVRVHEGDSFHLDGRSGTCF